jgi:hypothetical protein
MPFVTLTVRRGLSATDKSRLSEAMIEAQVAAGYHRADSFHRFLEVDHDDLLVDPRFPDYATDRTDRFSQCLSGYVEFWLRFIGVREVVTLTLEHTWGGRAAI